MEKARKSTMLRLSEQDLQAVLTIRRYYGITSDNQAIVTAINLVARHIEEGLAFPSSQAKKKEDLLPPHA